MIPDGFVNTLYQQAKGDDARIQQYKTKLSTLTDEMIAGGDMTVTTSGTVNGKSFGRQTVISKAEMMTALTKALELLGEYEATPSGSYANFRCIER